MDRKLPLKTTFGSVREACPDDTAGILRMVGKLAKHHGDTAQLTPDIIARDVFGQHPWAYVLVAEAEGGLIGYAMLVRLIQFQFGTRGMDMHHLFTEESFRGGKVGRAVVDACRIKAASLSCDFLTVGTHPDNHRAQKFYELQGFARKEGASPRFLTRIYQDPGSSLKS